MQHNIRKSSETVADPWIDTGGEGGHAPLENFQIYL